MSSANPTKPDLRDSWLRTLSPPALESNFDIVGSDVTYVTDRVALQNLVPDGFVVPQVPTVSVVYRGMRKMAWMGMRDYEAVGVRVPVSWQSPEAPLNPFSLVIWESDCAPIVSGRENLGAPKLYGEIPPADAGTGADHRFTCSEYGSLLVTASVENLEPVDDAEVARIAKGVHDARSYYWRYEPGGGGYPVSVRVDTPFVAMWRGRGSVAFASPAFFEAPHSSRVMGVLSNLPQLSECEARTWYATGCSIFRGDVRRLEMGTADTSPAR